MEMLEGVQTLGESHQDPSSIEDQIAQVSELIKQTEKDLVEYLNE